MTDDLVGAYLDYTARRRVTPWTWVYSRPPQLDDAPAGSRASSNLGHRLAKALRANPDAFRVRSIRSSYAWVRWEDLTEDEQTTKTFSALERLA